jgi:hypothetical protein
VGVRDYERGNEDILAWKREQPLVVGELDDLIALTRQLGVDVRAVIGA